MLPIFIIFGLIAFVAVYLIVIDNHLVTLHENVKKNWPNNESGNDNNNRIAQFPDVVVANWFGILSAELLEYTAKETAAVDPGTLINGNRATP